MVQKDKKRISTIFHQKICIGFQDFYPLFTFWDLRRHLEAIIWHPKSATDVARKAVGESGAHSVTFCKIGSSAHTFNSCWFILSWYIPYNKSFKCPVGVSVASQLVSTLESVMCRCVIWSRTCPIYGQVLSPAGAHSVSDGTYLFFSPNAILCPWNVSFQFVPIAIHPR